MCLAAWLLEGSYIHEGNKKLNIIFCFYACNSFLFIAYYFHHKFVRMQLVTIFTQYTELHNYLRRVAYLVAVHIIKLSLRV
jgi:hypothetical protein